MSSETEGSTAVEAGVLEQATAENDDLAEFEVAEAASIERLLAFLKENRAFDFTGYKRPSLIRRIRHRMREADVASVDDYLDILQLQ